MKKSIKNIEKSWGKVIQRIEICCTFASVLKAIDCFTDLKRQKNEKVSIHVRSCSSYFFRFLR